MKQMMMSQITAFEIFLKENERAQATITKYMRDVRFFYIWQGEKALNKTVILAYKAYLSKRYATTRIYTMETGEIHQAQIQHLGLVSKIQHNKIMWLEITG